MDIMSGGPLEPFTKGWARFPFVGMRAHYWREDRETMPPKIADGGRVRYYTSLCGQSGVTNSRVPALEPGNWPRCKRCKGKVDARRS